MAAIFTQFQKLVRFLKKDFNFLLLDHVTRFVGVVVEYHVRHQRIASPIQRIKSSDAIRQLTVTFGRFC